MQQLLNELNLLKLESLDDEWVQEIYNSEFLEITDFPSEYEIILDSVDITNVFVKIIKKIEVWLGNNKTPAKEKSWATLSHKINHERLLTLLFYYIDYGTKNVNIKEYRDNALLAARVYYKLLSIPGFKAYKIYHAQLFVNSLGCLNFPVGMLENDDSNISIGDQVRDVNRVIKSLSQYVNDLQVVLVNLQLKSTDMNFEEILNNLLDITGCAIVNKLNIGMYCNLFMCIFSTV